MDSASPGQREVGAPGAALLFVYGTLRRGEVRESLLLEGRFLRSAAVRGHLYDLGSYPALVPDAAGGEVVGEIWLCSEETLRALDTYEGVAEGLFARIAFEVDAAACWAYVAGEQLRDRLESAPRVRSGDWKHR